MSAIKVILGFVCWMLALLNGVVAFLLFALPGAGLAVLLAFPLLVFTIGLLRTGWFLVARRAVPIAKLARVMIATTIIGGAVSAGTMAWGFAHARSTKATNVCLNNLRQIDGAKEQWALENHKTENDTPSWDDIRVYLGRGDKGEILVCPNGGRYILGRVGELPRCSLPSDARLDHGEEDKLWLIWLFAIGTTVLACAVIGLQFAVAGRGGS
jgi:hypothetical protein